MLTNTATIRSLQETTPIVNAPFCREVSWYCGSIMGSIMELAVVRTKDFQPCSGPPEQTPAAVLGARPTVGAKETRRPGNGRGDGRWARTEDGAAGVWMRSPGARVFYLARHGVQHVTCENCRRKANILVLQLIS